MTELATLQTRVDGVILATYASAIEELDDATPDDRGDDILEVWRPGLVVATPALIPGPKFQRLRIWAAPWDEDGDVDPNYGAEGHRRANVQQLLKVFRKRDGLITVETDVPDLAGSIVTLTNSARVRRAIPITGKHLRRLDVTLEYPYPYHHIGDEISRPASASHVFTPGGNAEIWDMVYTFAGDGVLEHDETGDTITIAGSSSAVTVDVGNRTITQAGAPARNLARFNRPWWSRWKNPDDEITLTVTGTTVAVDYFQAEH